MRVERRFPPAINVTVLCPFTLWTPFRLYTQGRNLTPGRCRNVGAIPRKVTSMSDAQRPKRRILVMHALKQIQHPREQQSNIASFSEARHRSSRHEMGRKDALRKV